MKKPVLRMCVITREKLPKEDLIRIVKENNGNIFIDETLKANGKGCYLKKDKEVIEKAIKTKALDRIFETSISEEIYNKLLNY